jgi:peptidyl-prolyl cis-trans isomerase A (cyclophilin A)
LKVQVAYNMPPRIKSACLAVVLVSILFASARADTVVQFTFNGQINGVFGPVNNYQLQLCDNLVPNTVNNFLSYVNAHSYNGTIIHRNGKTPDGQPFVVQGGGYAAQFDSTGTWTGLYPIATNAPILNDSLLSNLRGTIAMARTSDPNSATSQWFINAVDNLALDRSPSNAGYAVFGQVVGEGMSLVDAITSLPNYTYSPAGFTELPLANYNGGAVKSSNFVIVTSAAVIPTIQWQGGSSSGSTNWALAANWSGGSGAPNGAGVNLVVGSQPSANSIIDMISGGGRTVGNIYFSAATPTTIRSTGGYSLTLDNSGNASTVSVLGNQAIIAPLILDNNTVFSGDGTLTLSAGVSSTHGMAVLGGEIIAKSINVSTLTIGPGSTITIQSLPGGPSGESIAPVPEPSAVVQLGIGLCGLSVCGWRWRKKSCATVATQRR